MKTVRYFLFGVIALAGATMFTTQAQAMGAGGKVDNAIWNDGQLYGTVATPTSFTAPPERTTDTIYAFFMSGVEGQRSISDAAPGDLDYNGGRWSVEFVFYTPEGLAALTDGNGNATVELTSDEALYEHVDLGHLYIVPSTFYFECPMLP